jgi:hypothetical protein
MKKIFTIALSMAVGFLLALLVTRPQPVAIGGQEPACVSKNGDVNADQKTDLSDAITILGHLFLGSPTSLPPLCASPGGGSGLPATGQTLCYTFDGAEGLWVEGPCDDPTCPGQDAAFSAGCPMAGRFEDNGDGTVTDTCTGLTWLKNTADLNGDQQISGQGDTVTFCDALTYCDSLSFGGYDDWRLPNVRELQSIVDYGRREPSIDPAFDALPQFYWTSTSYSETSDAAWGVGFNVGYVGIRMKLGDLDFSFNYVRAVRGGL